MPPALTPRVPAARPSAPSTPQGTAGRLSAPVAEVLLQRDLPGLPPDDRAVAAAFVAGRLDRLPSPLLLGVTVVALLYRLVLAAPGGPHLVRALARVPLPLVGEYPRLVRSLGLAFVYETWPDRRADGGRRA